MTKVVFALVAVVLIAGPLAACGGDGGSVPEGVSDASPATSAAQGAGASDTATSGTAASDAATQPDAAAPSTAAPDATETGDDSDSPSADASGEGRSPGGTSAEDSTSEDAESPSTTSPSTDSPSSTSSSSTSGIQETSDELEALYADELDELIEATERLRGLEFLRPPKFVLQDLESFRDGFASQRTEEFLETLDVWEIVYKLLGLLEPEDSLRQMYSDPGVAGYFQPETGEVFVPLTTDGMSIGDRSVIVHELVHALTEQHFNWGEAQISHLNSDKIDRYQALLAVIEETL